MKEIGNLKLHHIGVATNNIEKEFKIFEKFGYTKSSEVFCDEIQKIKGLFISAENQPTLELLENLNDEGPLTSILAKGIKFYHFAYSTNDIEKDLEMLVNEFGATVISSITEATYFEKICFVLLSNRMIVELVQERK